MASGSRADFPAFNLAMVRRPLDPKGAHSLPEAPGPSPPLDRAVAFSRCGLYRWWLRRSWNPTRPTLVFVGLNPSQADGDREDPTLRRLISFAQAWGYGQLEVLNLFARVASQPSSLRRVCDPVGEDNDSWIHRRLAAQRHWWPGSVTSSDVSEDSVPRASLLWLGWGNAGAWCGRDRWLLSQLATL